MEHATTTGAIRYKGILEITEADDTAQTTGTIVDHPKFTIAPALTTISGSTANFSARSDTTGRIYAVAVHQGSAAPTSEDVISGSGNSEAESETLGHADVACTAGVTAAIALTGLTYSFVDVYFAIKSTPGVASPETPFVAVTMNNGLPPGWSTANIGAASGGSATSQASNIFTLLGNGATLAGNSDGFRFAWITGPGDFRWFVDLSSITGGLNPKAGIMLRESTAANAAHMCIFLRGDVEIRALWRTTTGAAAQQTDVTLTTLPRGMYLTRIGTSITAAIDDNERNLTTIHTQEITFSANILAGMFVISDDVNLATAEFYNPLFQTIGPAQFPPSFVDGIVESNVTETTFDLPFQLNQAGSAWAVATDESTSAQPSSLQVKAGLNPQNNPALARAGPVPAPPLTSRILNVTGNLVAETSYRWHAVAEGNNGLLQAAPTRGSVTMKPKRPPQPPSPPDPSIVPVPNNEELVSNIADITQSGFGDGADKPWGNHVMTGRDDCIYFLWTDSGRNLRVSRKTPSGDITTSAQGAIRAIDTDPHHRGNMGIDEDGTIHVTCMLHNKEAEDGWVEKDTQSGGAYYKSQAKFSVTGGFVKVSGNRALEPTSEGPTYPTFGQNPFNYHLFVTNRATSARAASGAGWRTLALDRFNTSNNSWETCGGSGNGYPALKGAPTFWWNEGGRKGSGCLQSSGQPAGNVRHNGLNAHFCWSRDGRLLIAWDNQSGQRCVPDQTFAAINTSNGAPGEWQKANGQPIGPPPFTFPPGMSPSSRYVDLVANESADGPMTYPAFGRNNLPIIAHHDSPDAKGNGSDGPRVMHRWTAAQAWQKISFPPNTNPSEKGPMVGSFHGVLTQFAGNAIHRSWDNGQTWQTIPTTTGSAAGIKPDYAFCAREPYRVRFSGSSGSTMFCRTITLRPR